MQTPPIQTPAETIHEPVKTSTTAVVDNHSSAAPNPAVVLPTEDDKDKGNDYAEQPEVTTTPSVELVLANESFLKDNFPLLSQALDAVTGLLKGAKPVDKILGDRTKLENALSTVDYHTIAALLVPVPPGLKTDYLTYARVVLGLFEHASTTLVDVIDPLIKRLSMLISSEPARYSYNPIADQAFQKQALLQRDLRKALDACFDDSDKSRVYYEQAIRRNRDWVELYTVVDKITRASKLDYARIDKRVEEANALTAQIVEMNQKGEFSTMTKRSFDSITQMLSVAAEAVTLLSSAAYHGRALETSLQALVKQLGTVIPTLR